MNARAVAIAGLSREAVGVQFTISEGKETAMNCYECAKVGQAVTAVATCTHCSCGLCLEHLHSTTFDPVRGGMPYACSHDTWEHPMREARPMAAGG
jgi:hypothetical protein